jgi:hypothetical protein
MILGAMILGVVTGLVATVTVLLSGAGLVMALVTYPAAALGTTLGVLVIRAGICLASRLIRGATLPLARS